MPQDILKLQPAWLDAQRPRLGRYVVGPLLGKGGMGEVVEAWDVVLCRTVALKILRNMDPTSVIRFMHEAQVQARVAHPAICRVFDVDATDGTVTIAMQLVRGPTLEQARADLTLREKIRIMAQVAEGVHAAHRLKLIHRDLKPSNILLEPGEDGRSMPCICDFGLAMSLDEPALTGSNAVIGTPAYMAPEQFHGDRTRIGPATDVYCLGGTLHFLVTGRPPSVPDTAHGPRRKRPESEAAIRPDIPRDLQAVLLTCLQSDPALRYPSAAALAEDLWAIFNGGRVHVHLPGPLGKAWRRIEPRLKAMMPAFLAASGVLVGGMATRAHGTWSSSRKSVLLAPFQEPFRDPERLLIMARARPAHDVRPERQALAVRMEALREELKSSGKAAQAPGHAALARGFLLLQDFEGARREAAEALAAHSTDPDLPGLLAAAEAGLHLRSIFGTPEQPRLAGSQPAATPFDRCVAAFLHRDWAQACSEARAALKAQPWRGEGAALLVASLGRLAAARVEEGDLAQARARFQEALAEAQAFLPRDPSDAWAHHAVFMAARGLAAVQDLTGSLQRAFLEEQMAQCEQALTVDPGNPELQGDWLDLHLLEARRRMDQGQDPGRYLDEALIFQGTRLQEPLPPALRACRMAVFGLVARRSLARGENPFPALGEALKITGDHGIQLADLRASILVLQARALAARDQDPMPAVTEGLARLEPRPAGRLSWSDALTASELWLVRAEWEAAHQGNPLAAVLKAESLTSAALQACPDSPRAQALNGLALAVEGELLPDTRNMLMRVARERARTSLALGPCAELQDRLRRALAMP